MKCINTSQVQICSVLSFTEVAALFNLSTHYTLAFEHSDRPHMIDSTDYMSISLIHSMMEKSPNKLCFKSSEIRNGISEKINNGRLSWSESHFTDETKTKQNKLNSSYEKVKMTENNRLIHTS